MSGLTCCIKAPSCWKDFCRPVWAVCGCLPGPANIMATKSRHPSTFSYNHRSCAVYVPMKRPKYLLPITICSPFLWKKSSALGTFCGDMTKILLVGSGKYPCGGPCNINSSRCRWIPLKVPPALESSSYHVLVTLGWAVRRYRIRGRIPRPYAIMAMGCPWVTPYFIWGKWPVPSPSLNTIVAQRR